MKRRLGVIAVLMAGAWSVSASASDRFDQKLPADKRAVHALNRLTFGARTADLADVKWLGNVMFVLGGRVHGGRMFGQWPGLEAEQLFERRDLAVTTDFRSVLGELVSGHLGQKADAAFPGYATRERLGLLRP